MPQILLGTMTLLVLAGLGLVTTQPSFAKPKTSASERMEDDKYEPGHKFEYAHPPKDSAEAQERRDAEMRWRHEHRMEAAAGTKGPGSKNKMTHVNATMKGHTHHEDHPVRSDEDAKKWQDERMWRQTGTWQGGKDWNNARSKNWKRDRSTWTHAAVTAALSLRSRPMRSTTPWRMISASATSRR